MFHVHHRGRGLGSRITMFGYHALRDRVMESTNRSKVTMVRYVCVARTVRALCPLCNLDLNRFLAFSWCWSWYEWVLSFFRRIFPLQAPALDHRHVQSCTRPASRVWRTWQRWEIFMTERFCTTSNRATKTTTSTHTSDPSWLPSIRKWKYTYIQRRSVLVLLCMLWCIYAK